MKRFTLTCFVVVACLASASPASGQKGCAFNIVGTWSTGDDKSPMLYRFTPDGNVSALTNCDLKTSEPKEVARANYFLDDPKTPKVILIKPANERDFPLGTAALDIMGFDDTSFTCRMPGYKEARWVRVDPHRYFMVLAGRRDVFYDSSGPTFPMMIKTDGSHTQIDAVGIYGTGGYWKFGTVPADAYTYFLKEPLRSNSEVMLRLEINEAQYDRALKILRTWERRVRDNALLYPDLPMDQILLVKQVTESLNQCGERFKLYKLDWSLEDRISTASPRDDNPISRIPFMYFQELRRMNDAQHVGDEKFFGAIHSNGPEKVRR